VESPGFFKVGIPDLSKVGLPYLSKVSHSRFEQRWNSGFAQCWNFQVCSMVEFHVYTKVEIPGLIKVGILYLPKQTRIRKPYMHPSMETEGLLRLLRHRPRSGIHTADLLRNRRLRRHALPFLSPRPWTHSGQRPQVPVLSRTPMCPFQGVPVQLSSLIPTGKTDSLLGPGENL
jgi:hypothetical protein